MADTPSLTLTENALEKLRKLADGNGLAPDSIELVEPNESLYTVEGLLRPEPTLDVNTRAYAGPISSKGRRIFPSFAALHEEVDRFKKKLEESTDWLPDVLKELNETPGHGWGKEGGKIPLPERKAALAANEKCQACLATGQMTCDQCQGRSTILCPYCFGKGQENCYNCFGKGEDPVNPKQVCPVCRGTRFAPCRYCKSTGILPCPNCQGRGGTPCTSCGGAGSMTQEIDVAAHAVLRFAIKKGPALPSGLLRSLDRLGMTNLIKGHGDVVLVPPDPENPDIVKAGIVLRAAVPYAELKLKIAGKPCIAGAFGKRGVLVGVPPFLDESLQPWRERLSQAAIGAAPLENALEARALRDALALMLAGKGNVNEYRRLYSVGLSVKTAQEILDQMDAALRRITAKARLFVAAGSLAVSAGVFSAVFLSPLYRQLFHGMNPGMAAFVKAALPAALMGLSGFGIAHATRFVLQRKFPGMSIRLSQNIGKTGYGTLGGILVIYLLVIFLRRYLGLY